MPKKDKVAILRDDDFAEVEEALASAINQLDDANTRIEALLAEQVLGEDTSAKEDEKTPKPLSEDASESSASEKV